MAMTLKNPFATAAATGVTVAAAVILLMIEDPRAPYILIAGAAFAWLGLVLVRRPFACLCLTILFVTLPPIPGPEELRSLSSHLVVLLAFGSFVLAAVHRRDFVMNPTAVWVGLYLVVAVITLLWAPDTAAGITKIGSYIVGLMIVVLVSNQVRDLPSLDSFIRLLGAIGWFFVVAGLYTAFFGTYTFGQRLHVLDMNENTFGMTLLLLLPGALWPALRASGKRRSFWTGVGLVYLCCTMLLIVLSGSRGSLISLLVTCLVMLALKPLRPWGLAAVVIVLVSAALTPIYLNLIEARFELAEGGALGGRGVLWKAALMLIRDHFWMGVGVGNGQFELRTYLASLTSYYNLRTDLPAHNPLLEVGSETGVLGIFVYAMIPLSAIWQFAKSSAALRQRLPSIAFYTPLVGAVAVGYSISWGKSGGVEATSLTFIMLSLLIIPTRLQSLAERQVLGETPASLARPFLSTA